MGGGRRLRIMAMIATKKKEKPDYPAMADTLLRIAQELRQQARTGGKADDVEQAERLERIAAEIQGSES